MLGSQFDEVLAAARAGGDWAWAELYADLAPSVHGYLRGRGCPDPEDVTADVWLQAVRGLPSFEGDEAGFRSWLFTIAHRRMVDAHRKRGRTREDVTEPASIPEHGRSVTPQDSVEGVVVDAVTGDEITAVLERLKPAYREILLLRFIGGLTIVQCAEAMDKRLSATKAQLRRALAALRKELADGGYPNNP